MTINAGNGPATVKRAAVLVADDYVDLEFWYPVLRLREAGLEVTILGTSADATIRSELGYPVVPDGEMADSRDAHYDILIVPGGAAGDALTTVEAAVALTARLGASGALVATIGSGANVAVAAGVVPTASCADADGLPGMLRSVLAESVG